MRQQADTNALRESELERRRAETIQRDKLLGDRLFSFAEPEARKVGHPGPLESLWPIWGSGREAIADFEDHNYLGGAFNTGLAASDVVIAKAALGGLAKGGLKMGGKYVWRNAPWEEESMRQWMGKQGFLKPGQPGHHWWLEQKSSAPDWLKNQPLFIKGTKDAVEHGRIHGPYTVNGVKLPQFNAAQRFMAGTPDWWKALNVSIPGHAGTAVGRSKSDSSGSRTAQ
jgi:hypothetical protein